MSFMSRSVLFGIVAFFASLSCQQICWGQWSSDNYSKVLHLAPLEGRNDPPVITALAISPDGRWLAAAGDDHVVRILSAESGVTKHTLVGHLDWVKSLVFSADGKKLFSCGNDGHLWSWNFEDRWSGTKLLDVDFALFAIALHPDGDQIAACGFSEKVIVYSISKATNNLELSCSENDLLCIQYSPDGTQLAVGGRDGNLRIWDSVKGELAVDEKMHHGRLESLIFRSDGETINSVSRDRTLSRYDVLIDEQVDQFSLSCGKMTALTQLDSLLTAIATADNSIRLFCWIEQGEIRKLTGHQGSVSVLRMNQDTLYSGSFDTTIRAWDIEEILLAMYQEHGPGIIR
jgi:WD40 repeat protein